jgi:catechol 2,3-dioxygenase-like lactoylglutathione lyase family enzyme
MAFSQQGSAGEENKSCGGVSSGATTRFGPQTYERGAGDPATSSATFNAVGGPASLVLETDGAVEAQVRVNGLAVVEEGDFSDGGKLRVPLRLNPENTIEVTVLGEPGGALGVRVNQFTEADIDVRALMYFGINTSDMDRQRAFYDTLGLTGEIFPAGPEECRSFARSLGFKDNYRIFVALTSLDGAPPWIDTVEFRDQSLRDDPPYAKLNHLGMAYATYATTDLAGDFAYLLGEGVEFLSAPMTAPNGERFVFLRDPDGTFLKLIEEDGEKTPGPDLTRLVNTNMNVADLQRSRQFYRLLGFTEKANDSQQGAGLFSVAHGFAFSERIAFRGVDVSLPGTDLPLPAGGDPEATLQLRQWQTPYDGAPPYWPPVNHLGIDRIAFFVDDLNATVDEMNRLGFEQVGPIGGGFGGPGDIGIAFFYDPDGIKVEFWGPISEPNPNVDC